MTDSLNAGMNAALIVAHPGHELLIHHWMERHRPLYFCLTDGSGGAGEARIASTSRLLRGVGSTPGSIYGRYSDREIYRLLLEGQVEELVALRDELADGLIAADVAGVTGDAMEGMNPVHDLCRALIDSAAAQIRARTGRELRNHELPIEGGPAAGSHNAAIRLELDEAALERKLAAARDYPEMRDEVQQALDQFGRGTFAIESFGTVSTEAVLEGFEHTPPHYEMHGEGRVRAGRYQQVIRYREHVLPVFLALGVATPKPQWTT